MAVLPPWLGGAVELQPSSVVWMVVQSTVFFAFVYRLSAIISAFLLPGVYGDRLSRHRQFLWNSRMVSTLHSLYVTYGGIYSLYYDVDSEQLRSSPFYSSTPSAQHFLAVFAGYSLFDLVLMMFYWGVPDTPSKQSVSEDRRDMGLVPLEQTRPWELLFHHVLVLATVSMPLRAGMYHCLSAYYLINELSTPLLNLRYTLSDLGVSKSAVAYVGTIAVFILVFFVCRVLLNTWIFGSVLHATFWANDALWAHSPAEGAACVVLSAFMLLINLYWFRYMATIAYRFLSTDLVNKYE